MPTIYRTKVDLWLAVVLIVAGLVCTAACVQLIISHGASGALIGVPTMLLGVCLPLWLWRTTNYRFEENWLIVRSGPLVWRIRIAEITRVVPTRNPLSSPAFSLDRLRIDYGRGQTVMVSPFDKAGFLQELAARGVKVP